MSYREQKIHTVKLEKHHWIQCFRTSKSSKRRDLWARIAVSATRENVRLSEPAAPLEILCISIGTKLCINVWNQTERETDKHSINNKEELFMPFLKWAWAWACRIRVMFGQRKIRILTPFGLGNFEEYSRRSFFFHFLFLFVYGRD